MLKKAGLIVAASTASLLAVSPLAFAGDQGYEVAGDTTPEVGHDKGHDHHTGHHDGGGDQNSAGLVNGLNGNNVNVPVQACNNDVQGQVGLVPVQDIGEDGTVGLNGAVGALLGEGKAKQDNDVDNSRLCDQATGGAGTGND